MTDIYSTPIEALMAQLAGQANSSLMKSDDLNFPDRWDILQYFTGSGQVGVPKTQGFLAKGNIDPNDPTSKVVAALVLGIDWSTFLGYMRYSTPNPYPLPATITRGQGAGSAMEYAFVFSYNYVRSAIWSAIQTYLGNMDLYICGMGIGAPMAQLAALDLRPSATPAGPAGQYPPVKQPPCYAFSAPNLANNLLVNFYNQAVVSGSAIATNTYWAKKPGLTVDFFPSAPAAGILGNSCSINNVTLPVNDVPWVERGNVFYIQQLGGRLATGPNIAAKYTYPDGFDQVMANNCSQFVATSYSQTQHQSGAGPSGYTLQTQVNANGSPFAFIFTNSFNVVVAFRGTVTWKEALEITANSDLTSAPSVTGQIHKGINSLYNSPTETGGTIIFKDALVTAITSLLAGKKLYLTGHDIGGSLANLAAINYATNTGLGLTVKQVYTFGAISLGDSTFSKNFDNVTGAKCYQIIRIFDKVSTALIGQPAYYSALSNSIVINGQLPAEENTYHSINGYMQLLNPN